MADEERGISKCSEETGCPGALHRGICTARGRENATAPAEKAAKKLSAKKTFRAFCPAPR